jgi:enoyl-CoA hydratase/carnithine racemase
MIHKEKLFMEYENKEILVEKFSGGVAKLTINRPPLNIVSLSLLDEMYNTLKKIGEDAEVRAVVFCGSGSRAFCVGSDVKEFPSVRDNVAEKKHRRENEAFSLLEQIRQPVIAALEGHVCGGGMEMVTACDMRVAGKSAKFSLPEVNLGVTPCSGALYRLPKLIGLGRAYELMYLATTISADEAYRLGLVNRIVDDGGAVEEAIRMARIKA